MHISIAFVDSDNTTFDYFSNYLPAYYRTITFIIPLKCVKAASENYLPMVLSNYVHKPIKSIQLFSKIEQQSLRIQKVLLIIKEKSRFIYSYKFSVFRLDEFQVNGLSCIKRLIDSGISNNLSDNGDNSISTFGSTTIIGSHPILMEKLKFARVFTILIEAVLITGETGTGKKLLVGFFFIIGDRRKGLFLIFNCSVINPPLFKLEFISNKKESYIGVYENMDGRLLKELKYDGIIFV